MSDKEPNGKVEIEEQRYNPNYSKDLTTRTITYATTHIDRDIFLTAAMSDKGDILLHLVKGGVPIGAYEWHDGSDGVLIPTFSEPRVIDHTEDPSKDQAKLVGALLKQHLTKMPGESEAILTVDEAKELMGFLNPDIHAKQPETPDTLRGRTS